MAYNTSAPEVIFFSCSAQLTMNYFFPAHKRLNPTSVCILTFMSGKTAFSLIQDSVSDGQKTCSSKDVSLISI